MTMPMRVSRAGQGARQGAGGEDETRGGPAYRDKQAKLKRSRVGCVRSISWAYSVPKRNDEAVCEASMRGRQAAGKLQGEGADLVKRD